MATYRKIKAGVLELPVSMQFGFAAACLERIRPFAGLGVSIAFWEEGMELTWAAARGQSVAVRGLVSRIVTVPERKARSSAEVLYFAKQAFSALDSASRIGSADLAAAWVAGTCIELCGSLDYVLSDTFPRPVVIDPRQPSTPGRWETEECRAQMATVESLRDKTPIDELRSLARRTGQDRSDAVRLLAERTRALTST